MEVGLSILLLLVDNGVIKILGVSFFCLYLLLNFKPYFVMQSDVMCGKAQQSSVSESDPIISVVISNYPLANGGYLVSFGKDEPDGTFKNYDPVYCLDFEDSKLSKYLDTSPVFLPNGCYYLSDKKLHLFIEALFSGTRFYDMKLLPPASQVQGLLLVKVNEGSFFRYEQEEEE